LAKKDTLIRYERLLILSKGIFLRLVMQCTCYCTTFPTVYPDAARKLKMGVHYLAPFSTTFIA